MGEIQQDEFFTFALPTALTYITSTLNGEFEFRGASEVNPAESLHQVQQLGDKHRRRHNASGRLTLVLKEACF